MDENQKPQEAGNSGAAPVTPNPTPAPAAVPTPAVSATEGASSADTAAGTAPAAAASDFEFSETTIMAALSYFGPLVLIPFLVKKENPFVMFHIKQGIVLLVPYLVLWVLSGFIYLLAPLIMVAQLALLVLSIIGIINAVQKKEKELPYIGHYAASVKL